MKTKRRFFTLVLCGAMLFSLCFPSASAEAGPEDSVPCGRADTIDAQADPGGVNSDYFGDSKQLQWVWDGNGKLTITGTGNMPSFDTAGRPPWHIYMDKITQVVIDSGVTSIGDFAFNYCTNLSQVQFPNSLTAIGVAAFRYCTNLTLTELPDNLTSIGRSAFLGCTNLALAELPDNLTTIGAYAFFGCTNLALTKLPDNLTSIGLNAFRDCTNLALTELPDSLTSIGMLAFCGCTNLALTELPDKLTAIEVGAFWGCTNLTEMKFPEKLTVIGENAFYGCTNLTKVTFTGNAAPTLGYEIFAECDSLQAIYVPDRATGYDTYVWPADLIYLFAVTIESTENGTASASPAYAKGGMNITLSVQADKGYRFKEWQVVSGGVTISGNQFTMPPEDVTLKAVFEPIPYRIDVNTAHESYGKVSGAGTYEYAASVTVSAIPNSGYRFVRWEENGNTVSTDADYTFPADADRNLTAVFEHEPLTKIEETELLVVPDGLKDTAFNTVEKIKNELIRVTEAQQGYGSPNIKIFDLKLLSSTDGGNTWTEANEKSFPAEGITVVLPYPEQTGKSSHEFIVTHMFTITSEKLGTTAGQTEQPAVTQLDSGIQVAFKGLSPVSIAWKAVADSDNGDNDGSDSSGGSNGSGNSGSSSSNQPEGNVSPGSGTANGKSASSSNAKSPQTGDSSHPDLWLFILCASLSAMAMKKTQRIMRQ